MTSSPEMWKWMHFSYFGRKGIRLYVTDLFAITISRLLASITFPSSSATNLITPDLCDSDRSTQNFQHLVH